MPDNLNAIVQERLGNEERFSSLKYMSIVYGKALYFISWYAQIYVELKFFFQVKYQFNKKVLSFRDMMNYHIIVLSRSIVS